VFVTHDIDEAVKLGDQVAVLRVGGQLAQLAGPRELLEQPADEFVAGFVGKDRGYRALSFTPADGLRLDDEPTVPVGSSLAQARSTSDGGWVLVVDADQRPLGWLDPTHATDPISGDELNRGGTVGTIDGSLRGALDAALSSPTGRGVLADTQGRLLGTVRAGRVLARLEELHGLAGTSWTVGETVTDGTEEAVP
jgi:osmoprotectant transport system ATP-binding protein